MSSGVEFDEDNLNFSRPQNAPPRSDGAGMSQQQQNYDRFYSASSNHPKMVQWLMKKGLAKSPNSAQVILVAVIIINIAITYVVIKYFI